MKWIIKNRKSLFIGFLCAFIIFLLIQGMVKSRQVKRANHRIIELEAQTDTLYQHNKQIIAKYTTILKDMDSIYNLSTQSNEEEIKNYWDSIYADMLHDDSTANFLSEYFTALGRDSKRRFILP